MKGLRIQFVVCVRKEGYPVALERLKIDRTIPDARAQEHRLLRVVDESGEDYLYPADYFVPIEVPLAVEQVFAPAVSA